MTTPEQEKELNRVLDEFEKHSVPSAQKANPFLAYLKSNLGIFLFFIVFVIGSIYALNYEREHPITCDKEGTVKELISIEGQYANLKLQDDTMVKYQISRSVKNGQAYGAGIKPNDVVCLARSRK